MWTSHRDVKRSSDKLEIPRRTQSSSTCRSAFRGILARLFAGARYCFDSSCFQINSSDQMVLGVCGVQNVGGECETLRPVKSRFIERAVSSADISRANCIDKRAVEFGDDDAVVI